MKKLLILFMFGLAGVINAQTTRGFLPPTNKGLCGTSTYDYGRNFEMCCLKCDCITANTNCKHTGIDYCGSTSDDIKSVGSGVIKYVNSSNNRGLGQTVIVVHKVPGYGDVYSTYSHLSSINADITVGKFITRGYVLGKKGQSGTGSAQITHLHFEMKNSTELGSNPNTPYCVGYLKSTESTSSYGYYNPNVFLYSTTNLYGDIALDQVLPATLKKTGVNVSININSAFAATYNMDIRLALYSSTTGAFVGTIQEHINKQIVSGANTLTFTKSSLSSAAGTYKLQLDYKVPGSTAWIAMPTTSNPNIAPVLPYQNPRTISIVNSLAGNGNTDGSVVVDGIASIVMKVTTKQSTKIRIYPVPTSGDLTVELIKAGLRKADIILYDAFGKQVAQVTPIGLEDSYQTMFDMSDMPNGIYSVSVQCDDELPKVQQVVLQR